ncbi:MAG: HemK2/MTQ2 family protein methyltransferase [Candidatus Hodarchaeales archaeon]
MGNLRFIKGIKLEILPGVYPPAEDSYFFLEVIEEKRFDHPVERILDVGTGTGLLAIAAARKFMRARISATDINIESVKCAKMNFQMNYLKNTCVYHTNLFEELDLDKKKLFDLVLFNPPYLHKDQYGGITGQETWNGGQGGTDVMNRFLDEVKDWVAPVSRIFLLVEQRNLGSLVIPKHLKITSIFSSEVPSEKLYIFELQLKELYGFL